MFGPRSSAPWGSVAGAILACIPSTPLHSEHQDRDSVLLPVQAQALRKPRPWCVLLMLQLMSLRKEQFDDKTEIVNVQA